MCNILIQNIKKQKLDIYIYRYYLKTINVKKDLYN